MEIIQHDGRLPGYLASAVESNPDRIAVKDRRRRVTYRQLNEMSNALATAMKNRGLAPGARVGIWLNKSVEAIVGVYGTLLAGGAYVPLDPTAPPRRVAHVIADCRPSCLLTTADRVHALLKETGGRLGTDLIVLVGDTQSEQTRGLATLTWDEAMRRGGDLRQVCVRLAPDDLAYILYTSGSTGVPKGVMLTHRNACAFIDWAVSEFNLNTDDVLASHAPLHFDLSIFDIFGAAAAVGCLALIPESLQGLGYGLDRFVAEEEVSVWYSVPSALRRMTSAANSNLLTGSHLRIVAFAGEVYQLRHLKALQVAVPSRTILYNLYGPTETNVCTYHRICSIDISDDALSGPPIGRPCPYAKVVILDGDRVVPGDDGEIVGELCIAGESVMVGYWDDAQGTAIGLIQPHGHDRQYYRTGDIVRRDRMGRYFFIGRRDDMVKVKGYRVEIGEVEAALSHHPEVEEAACVAVKDSSEELVLVGFAAMAAGSAVDETALRYYCREFLPHYMIPQEILVVSTLAHTSTGKIDRQALNAMAMKSRLV